MSPDVSEAVQLIKEQNEDWKTFKKANDMRLKNLEDDMRTAQKIANRPKFGGGVNDDREPDAHTKSFLDFMRSGREADLQQKSMSSDSDIEGGFLVPTELDSQLTKYLRARSPMRQIARVVSVGSAEFKQPASTLGTGASWVGETQARTATATPEFKMLTIPTNEVYANCPITQALLDDNVFDLGSWLTEELGNAFGDAEADAFINGNGVARPRGMFTYDTVTTADATRAHDKFQYIATGGAGAFASSDPSDALIKLVYAVKAQYRTNASWLISGEVLEAVRKFKLASTGDYIWKPGLAEGQPATLLGYPVFEDQNIPAIAANSLSAAFGDFSRAYTITDRSTSLLRDPYTNKPYVNFYATKRVGGGGGRDTRSVKFLKFAAS